MALGVAELGFAAWVVSAHRPRLAALAQTAAVAAMNGGGIAWAREHVPAPRALLAENAAFVALLWWAAESDRDAG